MLSNPNASTGNHKTKERHFDEGLAATEDAVRDRSPTHLSTTTKGSCRTLPLRMGRMKLTVVNPHVTRRSRPCKPCLGVCFSRALVWHLGCSNQGLAYNGASEDI